MKSHADIEPCSAGGFVIRVGGFEQRPYQWVDDTLCRRVMFVPNLASLHFPDFDAARDFCWACDFTWSVKVR